MDQNDPNIGRRASYPMTKEDSYTGWIIGGIAALALMIALFVTFGRDDRTNTASNIPKPPPVNTAPTPVPSAPTTTGSGLVR